MNELKKCLAPVGSPAMENHGQFFYPEVRFWGGEQSAAILVSRPNYLRMFKYFLEL